MATRSAERTEFLLDVLTTAAEAGWSWFLWDNIVRDEDSYNIVSATVQVLKDDESGYEDESHVVNADTIARGIGIIKRAELKRCARFGDEVLHDGDTRLYFGQSNRTTVIVADRENDAGELDAGLADDILQVGVLGRVVFG